MVISNDGDEPTVDPAPNTETAHTLGLDTQVPQALYLPELIASSKYMPTSYHISPQSLYQKLTDISGSPFKRPNELMTPAEYFEQCSICKSEDVGNETANQFEFRFSTAVLDGASTTGAKQADPEDTPVMILSMPSIGYQEAMGCVPFVDIRPATKDSNGPPIEHCEALERGVFCRLSHSLESAISDWDKGLSPEESLAKLRELIKSHCEAYLGYGLPPDSKAFSFASDKVPEEVRKDVEDRARLSIITKAVRWYPHASRESLDDAFAEIQFIW